jgi:isoamylase
VSYAERHNEANGEDNKDGHLENYSANWGVEGPTEDADILDTRSRLQRALLATVFLAQGTPMLLGGDEFGRTQKGNNNAYCQDNEISWLDWKQAESEEGRALTRFAARIVDLRRRHAVLRSLRFMHGQDELIAGIRDIAWFDVSGELVSNDSWNNPKEQRLVLRRAGRNGEGRISILTAFFNATPEPHLFRLPPPGRPARLLIDSGEPDAPEKYLDSDDLMVGPRSVVLVSSIQKDGQS